ncbi:MULTISPECIES: hypothetical protein [unclassified Lacrimispora]|uniref:hypothetical protein n=1 Tax=unclassified Lacrimispora TaxID=2719232 RepID=UPI0037700103
MNILYNIEEEIAKYGLTTNAYEAVCKDIEMKLNGSSDIDWSEIKDKYDIQCAADTIRKSSSTIFGGQFRTEYLKNRSLSENINDIVKAQNTYKSESSINKDGTFTSDKLIVIKEDELKNPNSLLKAHGFDIRDWELVSARNNIWNVYSKQDGIQELYSSKIVVKPRSEISIEEIHDFYESLINEYSSPVIKRYNKKTGLLAEIPIMDLHLGKYSTSDIVSDEYNTQIARDCFNKVIDTCVARLRNESIEKIFFPIGQDFFHYDTVSTTTTGGTPQDSDRKHQTLFKDGVTLLIDGISKLSSELKAPIEVFCVPGNHDFMTSYHAVMSVWCYFYNNENVTVDLSTSPRKYKEFGKCLIGYSHGEKEKKRIEKIMQVEAAEAWGRTRFREFHLGHLHSEQVSEDGGVIVRNLSSVTGTDAWHHNSGYVGAIRKCTCFLWDKECGLDSTFNVVI